MNKIKYGFETSLIHIKDIIKDKCDLTNKSYHHIDTLEEYFNNVNKSLDRITTPNNAYHHFTPYIDKLVECNGKNPKYLETQDILELKIKTYSLLDNLNMLKKNSKVFYDTKESYETLDFFNNFLSKI